MNTMKRIIFIAILLAISKSATFWKEVGAGSPTVFSMTLSGPNEGYIVQGAGSVFSVYQMDWTTDTGITSSVKDIDVGTNANIVPQDRCQSDSRFNIVVSSNTIFRFNAQQGGGIDFEEYPVPKGYFYAYPFWAAQTNYMFVSSRYFPNAVNKKVYRLHSDKITDVKVFSTGTNTRSYGVLYGTGWLLVSHQSSNLRKLYDYTNGYDGGTNNVIQSHTKLVTQDEIGFFSPQDGRGYYVVCGYHGSRTIFTVKNDGSNRLSHHLPTLGTEVHNPQWIPDTDLCVVSSWGTNFAIVNFMDTNKPAPTLYTLPNGGSFIYQPQVWKSYKAIV